MRVRGEWTSNSRFQLVDADTQAPVAVVELHGPLATAVVEDPEGVMNTVLGAMLNTPHPSDRVARSEG